MLDEEVTRVINGYARETKKQNPLFANVLGGRDDDDDAHDMNQGRLDFVYPNGATLNVQAPAFPILSTGPMSYPCNRPISAVCN